MERVKIHALIRSRRRSIALMIGPDATLIVRAPFRTPLAAIEQLVQDKRGWIAKKLGEALSRPRPEPKKFVEGEAFFYLGKPYPLKFVDFGPISLEHELSFPKALLPDAHRRLAGWYQEKAAEVIKDRSSYFARMMGVDFCRIRINRARSRWGSCGFHGTLNFNWRLVLAPLDVVDYVVVHELAHLVVRNHSRRFWAHVERHFPGYKDKRRWLKENAYMLMF